MPTSFEQLWNDCESLSKTTAANQPLLGVLHELDLKVSLYRTLVEKLPAQGEELAQIKSRTMGEILFTLTKLSLKEDINVFEALQIAARNRAQ
jgi:hypothetical protein